MPEEADPTPDAERLRAAGGVVWRPALGGVEVVVVHRPRYDDWSLPKGKRDPGEGDEDCARREVEEETGLVCDLGPELATVRYVDQRGRPKLVRYWAMAPVAAADGDPGFVPNDEVDELRWLSVDEARATLSYQRDRDVLDGLSGAIPPS